MFGLAPALQASKPAALYEALKEGSRQLSFRRGRLRSLLMVSEVALALVLLIGTGLLVKSFVYLLGSHRGFDPSHLLIAQIRLDAPKYSQAQQRLTFYRQLLERLQSLPGVQAAGVSNSAPTGSLHRIVAEAQPRGGQRSPEPLEISLAGGEYFRAIGASLRKGRLFTDAESAPLAVINEALARRYWPDEDPIGRTVLLERGSPTAPALTVVGVIADISHGLDPKGAQPQLFVPFAQATPPPSVFVTVRTHSDPRQLAALLRAAVLALDKDYPILRIGAMEEMMEIFFAPFRVGMQLVGTFALLALVLATLGIYGVMSFSVGRRTQEIGIRMALGARRADVLRLVIRQELGPAMLGLAIGALGALGLTRLLRVALFGTTPTDPLVFAVTSLLLAAVALATCYLPARRATKADPMVALRYE